MLVIALDGVGDETLRDALAAGDLPALAALLGESRGDGEWANAIAHEGVVSVFPSETAAGWAAVFTGRPPAETGVVGNEWFDRDSVRVYAPVPLSIGTFEQTLEIYTDDFLGRQIQTPTLYDRADVRAHVANAFVYRGADVLTRPDLNDLGDVLGGAVEAVFGGGDELFETVDDDAPEGMIDAMEDHGVPDLQVVYFGGPDLAGHGGGPEALRAYLREETDEDIARVFGAYRERGALDGLWVVVVADHGQTELGSDESRSVGEHARALLDSLGRNVLDPTLNPDSTDFDAVMTVNEASAFVYLADASACDTTCAWSRPARMEEDVLPVARAFQAASDSSAGPLAGALDLVLVRAARVGETVPYRVLVPGGQGGDRLVALDEVLDERPDLVELERRLGWLTDGPMGYRAGDVLLLAKSGGDQRLGERFSFADLQVSGHGSASASDSIIPLIVARSGMPVRLIRQRVRTAIGEAPTQLDVTELVLALLEVAP